MNSFKDHRSQEQIDESLMAIAAKVLIVIGGIIGKALFEVIRDMGHSERQKLAKLTLMWLFQEIEPDIKMSSKEQDKIKAQMKELQGSLKGGEKYMIDIYLGQIKTAYKTQDYKKVRKILHKFKLKLAEWEETDALEYK